MALETFWSRGFALIRPLNSPSIVKQVQTFTVATGILEVDPTEQNRGRGKDTQTDRQTASEKMRFGVNTEAVVRWGRRQKG